MEIKKLVNQLVKRYGTRNPFILAKAKGIGICKENLGNLYGYSSTYKRQMTIHINSNNSEEIQNLVCAHELAYLLMYPKEPCHIVMDLSASKNPDFEKFIKIFITHLLISDETIANHDCETHDNVTFFDIN